MITISLLLLSKFKQIESEASESLQLTKATSIKFLNSYNLKKFNYNLVAIYFYSLGYLYVFHKTGVSFLTCYNDSGIFFHLLWHTLHLFND